VRDSFRRFYSLSLRVSLEHKGLQIGGGGLLADSFFLWRKVGIVEDILIVAIYKRVIVI
jgi:hypothetical protein